MKKITLLVAVSLLSAVAYAQTPQQLVEWVTAPEGWTKGEKVETFDAETLYERINGAADAFLSCKFKEMTTLDLLSNSIDKLYINVSMYRHASVADAFCIYAGERSPDVEFLNIGAEGYVTGSALHFMAGSMYVKIRSHSDDPAVLATIRTVATELAKRIDPEARLPKLLAALPQKERIERSDIYIAENFMGHTFLHSAYQASYRTGDKEYTAFIIDGGSKEETVKVVEGFLKLTKSKKRPSEGRFTFDDPYNGTIEVLVKGNFIVGVCMESKPPIDPNKLLSEMEQGVVELN